MDTLSTMYIILCTVLLDFGVSFGLETSTSNVPMPPTPSTNAANLEPTPPPPPQDYYTYYDYSDYTPDFSPGGPYCTMKSKCDPGSDISYPDKSCYCDKLCAAMGDCCQGHGHSFLAAPAPSLFSCVVMPEIVKNTMYGIMIVDKCPPEWTEATVKSRCEIYKETDDISLTLPVSDEQNSVMFKSMYCAYCNSVSNFQLWRLELKCPNTSVEADEIVDRNGCDKFYIRPSPALGHRLCPQGGFVNECPLENSIDEATRNSCNNGNYSIVFSDQNFRAYKNQHCAKCFSEPTEHLKCDVVYSQPTPTQTPGKRKTYTFRLLVDLNSRTSQKNEDETVDLQAQCRDNEMYDPFSELCREILCLPPLFASRGRCVYNTDPINSTVAKNDWNSTITSANCTLVKFSESEYEIINATSVFIFSSKKVYSGETFRLSGTDVFICLDMNQMCGNCSSAGVMFQFSDAESYVSMIGLIISILSLVVTFLVYICFPQLLNTPGKILVCLTVALFFAQLFFLISAEAADVPEICKAVGILVHYFFLSAFCWMNIIALDLWMTFSGQFLSAGSTNKSSKRLRLYNAYAWLVPMVIVSVAVILDYVPINEDYDNLRPKYGEGVCWIASRDALLLFFAGPLALFKLFDIVSFIFTSIHIAKAKRQGAMARQKTNTCSFLINLKLSMIMGLTWVFAFVANATNVSVLWFLFIVFNTLQGLLIAISFLCTKKVSRLLREKIQDMSKTTTTAGTQLTSLSKSNENKL